MKFIYSEERSLVPAHDAKQIQNRLAPYVSRLQKIVSGNDLGALEGSLCLPSDQHLLATVQESISKKQTKELKYLLLIGIGGSNLGTKAVYDALFGFFDVLQPNRFPKILFLDTQDESYLSVLQGLLKEISNPNQFLINMISKSGGTTETIVNFEVVYKWLSDAFGRIDNRVVCTTEAGSELHKKAKQQGFELLEIPKTVGGRYSIFSAVGLFPLSLVGIDVEKLRKGAAIMRDICVNSDLAHNPAVLSATHLYYHALHGKNIHDMFVFLPQLESLGKWYRQLLGESIGKDGKGITPTVSIGSTDLHSVGQLYLGGPHDKSTTFVNSLFLNGSVVVPQTACLSLIDQIQGKQIHAVMRAIVEGTKRAYTKQGAPFVEVVFEDVNEEEMGAFLQFKMIEMMLLGNLFGVNAFDQPHVELYKQEARMELNKSA